MVRNLYRFYLYLIYIGMLGFAASGLAMLLQLLFGFTPLRGGSTIPSHASVVQAVTFAVVSLVIAIPFWALHYWLIRRDMRSDPAAGSGAVRSFFLNFAEGISLLLGVFIGAYVIFSLGQPYSGDLTSTTAFSVVTLAIFVLLEWERRRSQATPGAAIAFQRIHIYGVQTILLIGLTFSWFGTVGQLLDSTIPVSQGSYHPNLVSIVASTLWIILFWLGYGLLARRERRTDARSRPYGPMIIYYVSFAYGVGMALVGINFLLQLALQTVFKASVLPTNPPSAHLNFIAPLTLGIIIVAVCDFWLIVLARRSQTEQAMVFSIIEVITTALLAVSFWVGCSYLLYSGFEHLASPSAALVIGLSAIIPGVFYVPLSLHLSRQRAHASSVGSRRALVFGLLTGGTLVSVGSTITLLYMLLTSLLGSPVTNSEDITNGAAAGLIVGLLVVGIYLWTARREGLIGARPKPAVTVEVKEVTSTQAATQDVRKDRPYPEVPSVTEPIAATTEMPAAVPMSIEDILDDLQADKLTRDEAAACIRELTGLVKINERT